MDLNMRLVSVSLKNFRSYKEPIEIEVQELTCLIGKNDVGKSTILEALDVFFNDEIDKQDLSVNSNEQTIEITCKFNNFLENIILDSTVETSLSAENLLNNEGLLEIKKTFTIGSTISKAIYIVCLHDKDEKISKILTLKNSSLKSLAQELNVDLKGINKTKNNEIRKMY